MKSDCTICGNECNGAYMRVNPRYTRALAMLDAPEVPKMQNGRPKLCLHCQRSVYFANGFMPLLIKKLKRQIAIEILNNPKPAKKHKIGRRTNSIIYIKHAMQQIGFPCTPKNITERLVQNGFPYGGNHLDSYVRAMLRRHSCFEQAPDGKWFWRGNKEASA